ncbi:MAG: cyclic nucleotide-binding domain-containing protein [Gammaproteobacteria bacterium]|nr:cyclic nucleotide-binding domain-containing protein [Gammaproteobacteria bacterium]
MFKDQSSISIIEGLTKGSITITRMGEYKKLLDEYPHNPFVNRLFADFLKKEHSFANAIKMYRKAYGLFMADGEALLSIAALFELWEIVAPVPYDFRALHSDLRRKDSHNSILAEYFTKMSYPELRATISRLEKVRVQGDTIFRNPGDPEDSLFFIISGELICESPVETKIAKNSDVLFLRENDHFGDYFPCEVKRPAPYMIKALSDTELLKITKESFMSLCEEYPNLRNGVNKLIKHQLIPDEKKPAKFFRKTSRRHLSISLSLDIIDPELGRQPLSVKGLSSDMSLGGACIIVDPRYRDISIKDILHRKARIRISLPDESINVSIMGNIAWCKEIETNGQPTCELGVQFNETPPKVLGSMIIFVNALGSLSQDKGATR